MNKNTRKRIISALVLSAVSLTTLMSTGCGKPNDDKKKIAVITKQELAFWKDVEKGAMAAGDELGVEILYNEGSSKAYPQGDNDYNTQIEYINYAIDHDVDAIVIAPNGKTELNDAFEKAEKAGIKLININSKAEYKPDAKGDEGILSLISSSDMDSGAVAARQAAYAALHSDKVRNGMAKAMKSGSKEEILKAVFELGSGSIGIIGHTAATAENRINGFRKEAVPQIISQMKEDGVDLAQFDISEEVKAQAFTKFFVQGEGCATEDAAYEEAKKMINENSGLVCMFATNTNTTLGVCKAIDELGKKDEIYVIGFNSDEKEIDYLNVGVLDGTIVQNPYNMGYVGVRYAITAAKDNGIPKSIDTGVTYVTAKNLTDEYIQLLLYPEKY